MRSFIMWNLVTLDGFFEGTTKWDLGWHESAWGDDLDDLSIAQLQTADNLLFGRITYEGMAQYWPEATGTIAGLMNDIPKVVASRTLKSADWKNSTLVKTDVVAEVTRIKQMPGKNILVFGSADLCDTLIRHDLIDEYRLCFVPVVLGAGTPLFKTGSPRPMKLLEARPTKSGSMILRYAPTAAALTSVRDP
ncbi:MAG: dihydrofolate reductase family protein [Gemmatimonadales bacterium]